MPVSLAQAQQNAPTPVDVSVINEFRVTSPLLDTMIFDDIVSPAGGGALSLNYRRAKTQGRAAFRAINSEYVPNEVTTEQKTATLAVLGGTFQIDRVLAGLGPAATNEVALNLSAKISAAQRTFANALINGDTATDANSFDGLSKALAGSSTEIQAAGIEAGTGDWTNINDTTRWGVLEALEFFLSHISGGANVLVANRAVFAKIRSVIAQANQFVEAPVPGLLQATTNGPAVQVTRPMFGNVLLVDAGTIASADGETEQEIIPVSAGLTDVYAYRVALDGLHGVSTNSGSLVRTWQPDFTNVGALQTGGVELGPIGIALKASKAAAVLRGVRVRPGA